MNTPSVSCPNCGYGFDDLRKSTRMFDCPSCDTTLFREADALNPIGDHGEMHDAQMLIRIGDRVRTQNDEYVVIGHVRYDYGRGFWDELWAEDQHGRGAWFSIDEGDVALQVALPDTVRASTAARHLTKGDRFELDRVEYTVTEADSANCSAFRGQLPERVEVGQAHRFINATGDYGGFASGESWNGGEAWYKGQWLDPFTLDIDRGGMA